MFYFDSKVYVFRGVDDVNFVLIELLFYIRLEISCCSRCDSNIMFLFLFYLVYGSSIIVYFIDFVR